MDNEIKNFWNLCIKKKFCSMGIDFSIYKFVIFNLILMEVGESFFSEINFMNNFYKFFIQFMVGGIDRVGEGNVRLRNKFKVQFMFFVL